MFRRRRSRAHRAHTLSRRHRRTRNLAIEALEERRLLAIVSVSNTNDISNAPDLSSIAALIADDGGDGISLREAITAANNTASDDEIRFNDLPAGVQTITITAALPNITDTVTIDGYVNRAGATPNTLPAGQALDSTLEIVIFDGAAVADGLRIVGAGASGSTIRGLVINGFQDDGIEIVNSDNNLIQGNYLGTNAAGNADAGNSYGVFVTGASTGNTIGGTSAASRNLISGNDGAGVYSSTFPGTTSIQGNLIGTNRAGTAAIGNALGVLVASGSAVVGGTVAEAQNVISGNATSGVNLIGVSNNFVQGNVIGLNVAGAALGNGLHGIAITSNATSNTIGGTTTAARNVISSNTGHGILIDDSDTTFVFGNYVGTSLDGTAARPNSNGVVIQNGASGNAIGSILAGGGNVISANTNDGVNISGAGTTNNSVLNNFIGTNAAANAALGNGDDGVQITNAGGNRVGSLSGGRNVISSNGDEGVEISGAIAIGNSVQGNLIGTALDGTSDLGNMADGVELSDGANNNLIGGPIPGDGNVIAFNNDGVVVVDDDTIRNRIQRNSIFNNDQLGIDLGDNGTTGANTDANDPDNGPNLFQNVPQFIGNATLLGDSIALRYRVNSAPANSAYPLGVEFFIAGDDDQEGRTFLAADSYLLAQAQQEKVVIIPAPAVLTNRTIVATATDANGNTSEFSAGVDLQAPIFLGSQPTIILPDQEIGQDDVDFYQYIAHSTGKLVVRIDFLHLLGDLALEVRSEDGTLLASSDTSSADQNFEQVIIPVVGQQRYFINVTAIDFEVEQEQLYALEVENFPAPVPSPPDLAVSSDTGMMNNDNVTSSTTPFFRIQADLANFASMGIPLLNAAQIDANNDGIVDDNSPAGAGVFVTVVNLDTGAEVNGFATRVGPSTTLWQFNVTSPLPDGEYFISAAVQIVDGAVPRATGRGQLSDPLEFIIDTAVPDIAGATIDLLAYADSGLFDDDNVTKINSPAFGGFGPANAKVHVFAQKTNTMGLPVGTPLLVGSGVVGSELSDGNPENDLGLWEVTVEPLVDGKYNFFARFESVSGAISGPVGASATKTNDTDVPIPDPGQAESTVTFALADFPQLVGNVPISAVPIIYALVQVNIIHNFVGDLTLVLIAPDTTQIELSSNNGGSGDNYNSTVFDDFSLTSITVGLPPFLGSFKPEQALAGLNGKDAVGNWTLRVTDGNDNESQGILQDWSLTLFTPLMVVIDTEGPNTPHLDLLDDTGRHDNDNITKVNTPSVSMTTTDPNVVFSQLLWTDNFIFRIYDRLDGGNQEVLVYDSAADLDADAVQFAGDVFTALTLLTRTLAVLDDGVHNLKLEVEDRAGNISHDFLLPITVDTAPPPVSFGLVDAVNAIDGLTASSDTGVTAIPETFADRITSDTTPTFWGRAEANTVVRLYLDRNANGVIDLATDTFLGQTVAVPLDGNQAEPDGYWEITSALDLNQLNGIPKDGLRRLLVTAQDVAGNPTPSIVGDLPVIDDGVASLAIFIDTQGPQITGVFGGDFDLFDPKQTQQSPTPLVHSLSINIRDLPSRVTDGALIDFLYAALAFDNNLQLLASAPGNYRLVGDSVGVIPIKSVTVNDLGVQQIFGTLSDVISALAVRDASLVGDALQPEIGDYIRFTSGPAAGEVRRIVDYLPGLGQMVLDAPLLGLPNPGDSYTVYKFAEAEIELEFFSPLPDDRYTLTVSDNLVDPAGNKLDGEANPIEPQEAPLFPTGDGVAGGPFVARFTIDSRPEIGVWAAGIIHIDTNGNFYFDPQNIDSVNRDLIYTLGFSSDYIFAGNFVRAAGGVADGFDKLAAYGRVGDQWRFLIDFDNDGVPDGDFVGPPINGIPVAGNFDGNAANGDEVGIFTGSAWYFDTNHDFVVDLAIATSYAGFPVVGDFDGDGDDDVATYIASQSGGNYFVIDINTGGGGIININGTANHTFRIGLPGLGTFGFPGVRERPVAADMNADGADDLGLWVPDGTAILPGDQGEWFFLLSSFERDEKGGGVFVTETVIDRIVEGGVIDFVPFTTTPFGNDLYARFGNSFALPIVGNFDPPISSASGPKSVTPPPAQSTPAPAATPAPVAQAAETPPAPVVAPPAVEPPAAVAPVATPVTSPVAAPITTPMSSPVVAPAAQSPKPVASTPAPATSAPAPTSSNSAAKSSSSSSTDVAPAVTVAVPAVNKAASAAATKAAKKATAKAAQPAKVPTVATSTTTPVANKQTKATNKVKVTKAKATPVAVAAPAAKAVTKASKNKAKAKAPVAAAPPLPTVAASVAPVQESQAVLKVETPSAAAITPPPSTPALATATARKNSVSAPHVSGVIAVANIAATTSVSTPPALNSVLQVSQQPSRTVQVRTSGRAEFVADFGQDLVARVSFVDLFGWQVGALTQSLAPKLAALDTPAIADAAVTDLNLTFADTAIHPFDRDAISDSLLGEAIDRQSSTEQAEDPVLALAWEAVAYGID